MWNIQQKKELNMPNKDPEKLAAKRAIALKSYYRRKALGKVRRRDKDEKAKEIRQAKDREAKRLKRASRPKESEEEKIARKEKRNEYQLAHKEEIKAQRKQYDQEHLKEHAERQRKWRKKHPDKMRQTKKKRRALKSKVKEMYTTADEAYTLELFKHKCFNCDSIQNLCIDHVRPLSAGFALTRQNACVLCKSCNSSKRDKMPEDFYPPDKLQELFLLLGITDDTLLFSCGLVTANGSIKQSISGDNPLP